MLASGLPIRWSSGSLRLWFRAITSKRLMLKSSPIPQRRIQPLRRYQEQGHHLGTWLAKSFMKCVTPNAESNIVTGSEPRECLQSAEAVWKLTLASSKEQLCVNPTGLRDEHRTDGA
jgi:hypothetical protein